MLTEAEQLRRGVPQVDRLAQRRKVGLGTFLADVVETRPEEAHEPLGHHQDEMQLVVELQGQLAAELLFHIAEAAVSAQM